MNFPILVYLASNDYPAVTQQKQPTGSLKTAPQLDISIDDLTYDLVLPADQLQPAGARGNYPAWGKAFCRGVATAFCANPINTDCLKPVHVNHQQIEERKVCPLFKGGLSELVKSWGLVGEAKEVANQERQTNTLPSHELQGQLIIIQDTGPTLTSEGQRTLNEGVILSLKYGWYDFLERIQSIIVITGAELTEDARIALSNALVQAVDHRLYDMVGLLLSIIVSTGTELTQDDRIALSNGLIMAVDHRLYDKAELLKSVFVSTETELTEDARIALSNGLILAVDNRHYDKDKPELLLSIIVST
ncbi:hypothetical protein, partial [Salinisphaera sp. G21_0]|uniref:hypothetical protein n=1 Tax=Salinisphaera sp. G21_0 TaxID=2821094 RepID=UPI001ADA73D7